MIKNVLKLGFLLVVGIIFYNYFLGTPEEKESSKRIFTEIKEVGKSVGSLIKAEREKFDAGKYDNALDKIGGLFEKMKSKAKDSKGLLDRITNLEGKKNDLKEKLAESESNEEGLLSEEDKDSLKKELAALVDQTTKLVQEIEE